MPGAQNAEIDSRFIPRKQRCDGFADANGSSKRSRDHIGRPAREDSNRRSGMSEGADYLYRSPVTPKREYRIELRGMRSGELRSMTSRLRSFDSALNTRFRKSFNRFVLELRPATRGRVHNEQDVPENRGIR